MDDGREGGGEIGGTGALEVFGGGGIVAGEDVAGVVESHLLERGEKNLLGLGSGLLGGAVHADFEFVHFLPMPSMRMPLPTVWSLRRKQDPDGFVFQESVGLAGERDSFAGADLESLLQPGDDFVVAEAGGVAVLERVVGFFEDVVELSRGGR